MEGLAEIFAPLYVQVFKKNLTAENVKAPAAYGNREKVIILQTGVYSGIRCFWARYAKNQALLFGVIELDVLKFLLQDRSKHLVIE